uniref:Calcium-transporting ATPase n=1 Tax=Rhizophora mucronata TaxID=61149 RepID=A0A2P2MNM4_RHIMU
MTSLFKGSPYRRRRDLETGGSRSSDFDIYSGDEESSSTFYIPSTKNASVDRLRRWRQAALVLNASRRFRYTLDLKKEEEKKQILRKIRAHAQAIRAAYLFKEAGLRVNGMYLCFLVLSARHTHTHMRARAHAHKEIYDIVLICK